MKSYYVRYWSEAHRSMALHSVHGSHTEATIAARQLANSFRQHGQAREAASVRVTNE